MKNKSATELSKIFVEMFNNLKLVAFIVVLVIGLIFAIITLSDILKISSDSSSSNLSQQLDQTTMSGINKLNVSNDNSGTKPLPSGRVNPFAE